MEEVMIYQDLNGVLYINEPNSGYLLRFTYESISKRIELFNHKTNYDHIRYYYTEGILYYADKESGISPGRSSSVVWPDAIQSILDGTAVVELVPADFLETWKSEFKP